MASTVRADASVPTRSQRVAASLRHGGTTWLVLGSLVAGVGAYLFQTVGARAVGEVDYAPISVLWTVQYLLSSIVMTALESWVVRTVRATGGLSARTEWVRLAVGVVGLAAAAGLVAHLAADQLLDGHQELVAIVPMLVVAYAAFVVVRGVLAARERYKAYGGVTALESVLRLAAAVAVAVTVPSPLLLALCLPLGAAGGALWGAATRLRARRDGTPPSGGAAPDPAVRTPGAGAGRFLLQAGGANVATQVLLASGPLVVAPLGAGPREVSVLFVTLTAARVPLVVVQGGLLSRLLPAFTAMVQAGRQRALLRAGLGLVAATAAAAVLAAVAGWVVGPTLVELLFGEGFRPGPGTVAAVAGGVVLGTGAILVNQVLIAAHRERALLLPWWAGLGTAALVVALTSVSDPTTRVLAGLVVGEATALVLLGVALLAVLRDPHPSAAASGDRTLDPTGDPPSDPIRDRTTDDRHEHPQGDLR